MKLLSSSYLVIRLTVLFVMVISCSNEHEIPDSISADSLRTDSLTTVYAVPDFDGIEVVGMSLEDKIVPKYANELKAHMRKCRKDSPTFRHLLFRVGDFYRKTGKKLKITVYPSLFGTIIVPTHSEIGHFLVDLSELRLLPDPIKDEDTGLFELNSHHPKWATFLGALLGHEIEEAFADLKAGKRDWDNHHYKIAIPTEDAIVKDYSGVFRKRGKDTYVKHLDHSDIVMNFDLGIIRFHSAPSHIRFDQHGDIIGQTDPGRLNYITYEIKTQP